MSGSPTVIAIITPVWNGLPYIKECVASVLAQEFRDWEMIIGDNCSTDGTREYLDTLADPRIRVIRHEQNQGIYGNLNILFALAEAPVAQLLCADDYMLAHGLEKIIAAWATAPTETGLIRFKAPSDDRDHLRRSIQGGPITPELSPLYFFLFGSLCGNLSNVSLRPQLVRKLGGFPTDQPYTGDTAFWVRLAGQYPIQVSRETVNHVRRHPGAASNYLNRNGELAGQEFRLMAGLFQRIHASFPDFLLRWHATVSYDARHRDAAIKKLIFRRNADYFRNLEAACRESPIFFGPVGRWLVFFFSAGARLGPTWPARLILKQSQKQNHAH